MTKRYPLQPLLDALAMSLSQAQDRLGLGGPEYRRYRDEGMSRDVAERKAVRTGHHPYEVWPEMVEHDLAGSPRCARSDCPKVLPDRAGGRRYCTAWCRREAKNTRMQQRHGADRGPRTCVADECHNLFVPRVALGKPRIYCSKTCRVRETMRTYRSTEKGQRLNRQTVRRYKARARAQERAAA